MNRGGPHRARPSLASRRGPTIRHTLGTDIGDCFTARLVARQSRSAPATILLRRPRPSRIITSPSVDYEALLVAHLPLIDSVVRAVAHRYWLSADETDDLGGDIRLKLVENDHDVLRKFEGRSSLRTYLMTVVLRHVLDQRNARWGKWRPSVLARQLGPIAILLDQLLTRDGLSFDEAVETTWRAMGR